MLCPARRFRPGLRLKAPGKKLPPPGRACAPWPLPAQTLDCCRNSDGVLLAAIGGYKWDNLPRHLRPETGLLGLRAGLGLFANLRPATILPQLIDASSLKREVVEGVVFLLNIQLL